MLGCEQVEELIHIVRALDRNDLIDRLRNHPANFPLDFTAEFLGEQSTERLRHIFMALCLHTQRMPEIATPEAA
jgi:hypothetical protein